MRPSPEQVLLLQLPSQKSVRNYERALVQYLASRGLGLNKIKRVFDHRSKDEVRNLLK